ncbi:MAG: hypothetical protein IJK64_05520 [Clostridia bacterium]|nr:hypothetical protein [Clostridia bacterium]
MADARLKLDPKTEYQRFEGIGASGAWWAQLVGGWAHPDPASDLPTCERIAQLLFSKTQGIGLRAYRYNIGAGSADSGRGDISMALRRTHSPETPDGKIDLDLDRNAVHMAELAVQYGADELVLFVNSPPERLTKNGKAHCDKGFPPKENLARANYAAFAAFCLDVTQAFLRRGLPVTSLSPINEPLWVWTGGQEGCHYRPRSAGKLMQVFAQAMAQRPALDGVRLAGLENGDIRWFNKSYARALLRDPAVRSRIDAVDIHSYFLQPVSVPFFSRRPPYLRRFRRWMARHAPDKQIRVSEWCHMQGGRDPGMDSALVMAQVMQEDLTILNASAWQHWIAVSEVDFCDGLIYIEQDEGTFSMTKRYYATGNYSKYIPYGAVRIKADCGDPALRVAAFRKDGGVTAVVINPTHSAVPLTLPAGAHTLIVTDENENLQPHPAQGAQAVLTPRSVTTILIHENEPGEETA